MAPGPSHPSHPPPGGPSDPGGLRVRDAEIAALFRDMRRALQQTKDQLAQRFATPVETIEALEAGELLALPEWPETSRVVLAYTGTLELDPRPILRRIHTVLMLPRAGSPGSPPALAADRRSAPQEAGAGPKVRRRRRVLPWVLLLAILAATFSVALAINRPNLLRSAIDQMPDPIPRLARAGLKLLKPAEGVAITREASEDPRSRKADKLPQAGASTR